MNESEIVTRRKFIGTSALAGAAASFPYVARGEDLKSDTIRVAAIGLGGRGTGAIGQILDAPKDLEKQVCDATPSWSLLQKRFLKKLLIKSMLSKRSMARIGLMLKAESLVVLMDTNKPSMKMSIWWSLPLPQDLNLSNLNTQSIRARRFSWKSLLPVM